MALFTEENIFIVTGASSGIGKTVALKLVEEGAKVVSIARNLERLQSVKAECVKPECFLCENADFQVLLIVQGRFY